MNIFILGFLNGCFGRGSSLQQSTVNSAPSVVTGNSSNSSANTASVSRLDIDAVKSALKTEAINIAGAYNVYDEPLDVADDFDGTKALVDAKALEDYLSFKFSYDGAFAPMAPLKDTLDGAQAAETIDDSTFAISLGPEPAGNQFNYDNDEVSVGNDAIANFNKKAMIVLAAFDKIVDENDQFSANEGAQYVDLSKINTFLDTDLGDFLTELVNTKAAAVAALNKIPAGEYSDFSGAKEYLETLKTTTEAAITEFENLDGEGYTTLRSVLKDFIIKLIGQNDDTTIDGAIGSVLNADIDTGDLEGLLFKAGNNEGAGLWADGDNDYNLTAARATFLGDANTVTASTFAEKVAGAFQVVLNEHVFGVGEEDIVGDGASAIEALIALLKNLASDEFDNSFKKKIVGDMSFAFEQIDSIKV